MIMIHVYIDSVAEPECMDRKRKGHEDDGANVKDDSNCLKKKKARTTFTGRQIFELEKQFEQKKYLSSAERAEMASQLAVTETQVSIKASDFFAENVNRTIVINIIKLD